MRKPSVLYASPFPPQESGIADYSVCLVLALREFFDVTLYIDTYEISDPRFRDFPVVRHGVDHIQFKQYDYCIYQIGNNPWLHGYIYEACLRHPGLIVLHEPVIYFLTVGIYRDRPDFYSRLFRVGGPVAVSLIKRQLKEGRDLLRFREPEKAPLNRELLLSGSDIMVHSEYSQQCVLAEAGPGVRVYKINQVAVEPSEAPIRPRESVLAELGIPAKAKVVASFGFVAPTKLNHVVCRAVQRLNQSRADGVYYLMIGRGDYVDSYLGERIRITGYVNSEEFEQYLKCCDLVLNLRYPTMGETSAALLRAMRSGKPCIVSDVGWFSELPDNTVLKLTAGDSGHVEEELFQALDIFLDHPKPFSRMAENGAEYVRRHHAPVKVAGEIFRQFCDGKARVTAAG
jgi:glycosyltransferase involved in cell wall biosynthesis